MTKIDREVLEIGALFTNVTWSWEWNGVDRNVINAAVKQAVRKLFP